MKIEDEIKQPVFSNVFQKGLINILYTAGWISQRNALQLKEYGITSPQFNVLRILRGQHPKPATVNLLIERMLDKTSNASRIVDKLELKKLVTRTVCPSNRRAVDIRITEAGLTLLSEIDTVFAQEPQLRNLTEAEASQLNDLLDKIRD
ncbi:MarR family transcriptional regulator [Hymenobacter sp. BT186]|uniref:MarR family transcriptional regulator n=1 Tax=Hymenobacter telluris TaxID=2816474 RepID=A0A939EYT7_9BACT|nr:MarR family transcriptional regulator [Hymenobacter telluris]MBO0360015.1 MarR family transcriptional regulator [Hymenobacter telluris]MBW3376042.1 MarR family transcriptional regulator [Hymenobacter norwichensis]